MDLPTHALPAALRLVAEALTPGLRSMGLQTHVLTAALRLAAEGVDSGESPALWSDRFPFG